MSVDLSKNRDQIVTAWKEVLNTRTSTNWALFGYEGQSNALKVVSSGDGGLIEISEDLNSGKIMYAFVGVDDPKTTLTKYILINWQGEGVPALRKGTCANHIRDVQKLFTGAHLTINARTEDEVDADLIMAKLNAVGSAYSFKEPRMSHDNAQSGPIGTNYSRVNPSKEISSQDRDDFWRKEEEEERHRVELERERRDKELLKQEEERRSREEREHQERERRIAAETVEEKVPVSNGKSYIQAPTSPVKVNPPSPQRSVTQAEEMRQQRNKEAKELIGGRVGTAKAIFTQNSAAGQMSTVNKAAAPAKPVRNSIAQRINSLNNPQDQQHPLQQSNGIQNGRNVSYNDEITNDVISTATSSISTIIQQNNEASSIKVNHLQAENVTASPQKSGHSEEDDGDQYSTIKRSPYSKGNNSQVTTPVDAQPPSPTTAATPPKDINNTNSISNSGGIRNGNGTVLVNDNSKIEDVPTEHIIYQNIMGDEGLTARALYDYQADDESEITFDPGDIITHIDQIDEGWWQGYSSKDGSYGLFPANYVELIH